jgi:ABC-2 type transport system ATP-binding protein
LQDPAATIVSTTYFLEAVEAIADRLAVTNRGKILEISIPPNLGNRSTSLARVQWKSIRGIQEQFTYQPTAVIAKLMKEFTREIPRLCRSPATLEDVYLQMID